MFYRITACLCLVYYKLFNFVRFDGRENIPDTSCLICANHTGLSDPILLGIALGVCTKVKPRFMAKAEIFKNKLFGALVRALGAFPVRRGETDVAAIKEALRILKSNGRLILFPEGTRNHGDVDAKAGTGMLAYRTGCGILPVYITPGRKPFHKIVVTIGNAFSPTPVEGKPSGTDYQALADETMRRVYELRDAR